MEITTNNPETRIRAVLTKLAEADQPLVPGNIPAGYSNVGVYVNPPTVGQCFFLEDGMRYFRTSTVQEVIDEFTFRTYNSIYRITHINTSLDGVATIDDVKLAA